MNGSRAGELDKVSGGQVTAEAVRRMVRIEQATSIVEPQIERGGTLAGDGVPAGIVDGIVAIDRYEVVVMEGRADTGGGTAVYADGCGAFGGKQGGHGGAIWR